MKKLSVFMVLLALALAGCAKETAPAPELLTPVGARTDAAPAVYGDIEEVSVYQGAFAVEHRELFFTHDCSIAEICVPLGGEVAAGECVARMDVSAVRSEMSALEREKTQIDEETAYETRLFEIDMELFSIESSKTDDENVKYDIKTEAELRALEFSNEQSGRDERLSQIASELAALEKKLDGTELFSPCDGRLVLINAPAGSAVGAYDTVCVIADNEKLIIQSPYIASAALNSAVEIYALSGDKRFALVPRALDEDDYARTVLRGWEYYTEYDVSGDTTGVNIGDGAAICVVSARLENVLYIPANALYGDSGEYYVYVMDGESRERRDVSAGLITTTSAQIISGVEEGELVYVGN